MRFDVNNSGKYFFDERQTLTKDEWYEFQGAYHTESMEIIKDSFNAIKDHDDSKYRFSTPKKMLVPIFICVALIVISVFFKSPLLSLGAFSALFVFAGISTIITGGVSDKKNMLADTAYNRFAGLLLAVTPSLAFLSWFVILRKMSFNDKLFIVIGEVLAGIAILLICWPIFQMTAKRRVYTEEVNATCIGYARYIEYSNDEGTSTAYPKVSPVFEYYYGGERYVSCYDSGSFTTSTDCDVRMGPSVINISPKYPEGVYNPIITGKAIKIIIGVFLLFCSICAFIAVGTGITGYMQSSFDNSGEVVSGEDE